MPREGWNVAKGSWIFAVALFFAASLPLAGQDNVTTPRAWSGVIINASCTADEAFAESSKCTESQPGAKLALFDDTIRQVYNLDPQDQARGFLGESVTVRGTLEGDRIHVASLKKLTSFGLPVGRKAPAFSARDQFGHVQNLDTLKGANGTVILFFRSADW
jgi:hypothetical protein